VAGHAGAIPEGSPSADRFESGRPSHFAAATEWMLSLEDGDPNSLSGLLPSGFLWPRTRGPSVFYGRFGMIARRAG
jgi:hypothetical protein